MQMALVFAGLGVFDMFALTRLWSQRIDADPPVRCVGNLFVRTSFRTQPVRLRHRDRSARYSFDVNTICADPVF